MVEGNNIHTFNEHAINLFGAQALANGQNPVGGYKEIGPNRYEAKSTITALRPVIEQGIGDVLRASPNARGEDLERKIAQRLTQLNDWENLTDTTKENLQILAGMDFKYMSPTWRESTLNHLLHSPLPFGDLDKVLPPDGQIMLNYTHTLDKNFTQAVHIRDGIFKIWMISNNNNGSHTGHIMGSFMVQLTPDTSPEEARRAGNQMIINQNKNNMLYLDESAKKVLYGEVPFLDFSYMTEAERKSLYEGHRDYSDNRGGPYARNNNQNITLVPVEVPEGRPYY